MYNTPMKWVALFLAAGPMALVGVLLASSIDRSWVSLNGAVLSYDTAIPAQTELAELLPANVKFAENSGQGRRGGASEAKAG